MGFLTGKTAIITGGGRATLSDGSCGSIGYGIATAYAKEGANLTLTGRNVKKLEDAKEELERLYGIKVLAVQADVSAGADNKAVVEQVIKQTVEEFGRIDVLINNAQEFQLPITRQSSLTWRFIPGCMRLIIICRRAIRIWQRRREALLTLHQARGCSGITDNVLTRQQKRVSAVLQEWLRRSGAKTGLTLMLCVLLHGQFSLRISRRHIQMHLKRM